MLKKGSGSGLVVFYGKKRESLNSNTEGEQGNKEKPKLTKYQKVLADEKRALDKTIAKEKRADDFLKAKEIRANDFLKEKEERVNEAGLLDNLFQSGSSLASTTLGFAFSMIPKPAFVFGFLLDFLKLFFGFLYSFGGVIRYIFVLLRDFFIWFY